MQYRKLGSLGGIGPRPRLHGHVRLLRRRQRGGIDRDDPPRAGARRHLPRHRRHVRPRRQRGAGRPRHQGQARRRRPRDQVRHRARQRRGNHRLRRPARLCAPGLRGEPEAARRRDASTSTISTASIPTRRSRTRSAPWPSSCARARCATSACPKVGPKPSAGHTRCIRSPRCRANTRCGRASPRRRSLRPCASSASASSPTARSAAAFSPDRSNRPRISTQSDYRRNSPRFQGENFQKISISSSPSPRSRQRSAARRRSSRWLGCWRRASDIVPIPGTKRPRYIAENIGALALTLTPADLQRIDERVPARRRRRRALSGRGAQGGQPLTPRQALNCAITQK